MINYNTAKTNTKIKYSIVPEHVHQHRKNDKVPCHQVTIKYAWTYLVNKIEQLILNLNEKPEKYCLTEKWAKRVGFVQVDVNSTSTLHVSSELTCFLDCNSGRTVRGFGGVSKRNNGYRS